MFQERYVPNNVPLVCAQGTSLYVLLESTGILVSSTPIAVNNATADIAIFLMIGALRQAHIPLTAIRAGKREKNQNQRCGKNIITGLMQGIGEAIRR